MGLGWRVGVEIELVAPRGRTRRDLAAAWAGPDGRVVPFFHVESEPSLVPGTPVFDVLTLGFRAETAEGRPIASCVDDLTLQDGLDKRAPPQPGWFRIVSDDRRLLHLIRRHGPCDQGIRAALEPAAALFGTTLDVGPEGMLKLVDEIGSPIAIGAALPGERERPCEVVTPPIAPDADLEAEVDALLAPARSLAFSVPAEAAVHLHLEARPLEDAAAFANLVELLVTWGDDLKRLVRTNPRCVRLGPIPDALRATVRDPDFRTLPWERARERLAGLGLSKYVDYNVKNLAHPRPDKPTFEVRVLPSALRAEPIAHAAALFVAIARRAAEGPPVPARPAATVDTLLDELVSDGFLDAGWR